MPEEKATVLVLAKAPVAGRVKTRLTTEFTPGEAAELAQAALLDTLDAALTLAGVRVVLALDGTPGPWLPSGLDVLPQRGRGLDERIEHAFADAAPTGRATLLVGMDTPQVTTTLLATALTALHTHGSVLGLAADGGWWALGLTTSAAGLVVGIPMSTAHTGAAQLARLGEHGLAPHLLPTLRDVDTPTDARAVAEAARDTRFAALLRRLDSSRAA